MKSGKGIEALRTAMSSMMKKMPSAAPKKLRMKKSRVTKISFRKVGEVK